MKKLMAILMVSLVCVGMLAGCKRGKCDLCGEDGRLHDAKIMGESIEICTDCKEEIEELQASFR